jgi:DNA primase, catalytic core
VRFDDHFLEEIKSRLRPSDVIGRTVKLRKQGREYVGLSPFNKEKTPSFYVNDEKGQFFDFSSGKNGDLITFLQETERLSFMEAVERLAAEAGLPMPAADPRSAEQERQRQSLTDWMEAAAQWFEAALRRPEGREARAYLERRGLPEKEWSRFRLGYSPSGRTALKDYLITKGAKPGDLVEAGLLIAPEEGGAPYDRFRDRIIFPIADHRGRILSFGGRAMDPQARAKYLNGPESPLFHKGRTLYGVGEARKILAAPGAETPPLVVVEGYMDAIACQRAGIAAVAPLGTALTEEQMEMLWRLHPEPTLCFDGDRAGMQAASRVIDRALPLLKPGKSFKFAIVEGGKDPDEVLREQGPTALISQLARTTPFSEALFRREYAATDNATPEQRAGLKVRLRQTALLIGDKDLAEQYKLDLLDRFEAAFPRVSFIPNWNRRRPSHALEGIRTADLRKRLLERARRLNAAVATVACEHPDWVLDYVEELQVYGFGDDRLKLLSEAFSDALSADGATPEVLNHCIRKKNAASQRDLAFRITHETPNFPLFDDARSTRDLRSRWKLAYEAIIELEAIKRAVAERDSVDALMLQMSHRLKWRERRLVLERQLNDLSFLSE